MCKRDMCKTAGEGASEIEKTYADGGGSDHTRKRDDGSVMTEWGKMARKG